MDKFKEMLVGAMAELTVGDPLNLSTDIGPVIDQNALAGLLEHEQYLSTVAQCVYKMPPPISPTASTQTASNLMKDFFTPCVDELSDPALVTKEGFGPILHLVGYDGAELDKVIAHINGTGYGLTLGIHSRIDETSEYICSRVKVGNIYVNRNMIGAVVGVQPFGGEGLSGTGPKAGGPHYLQRLSVERTVSVNTAAVGGNASLMSLME